MKTRVLGHFLVLTSFVLAQTQPPLVSPEVHPDRRVTFRVAAPKATEVTLTADWQAGTQRLEKDATGTWSLTVGPLAPSSYIYSFNLDGLPIADPVNPRIKLRERTSASIVVVPSGGSTPAIDEPRDVPRGAVEINWHKSAVLAGEARSFWVYTPPGYTADAARRYPVLYLLHGNNDRPAGWIDVGNLNAILDNLIAEKKAEPMIVVMTFGHALPFGQRGQPPRTNTTVFADYLIKDVMPAVEAKYRTAAGRAQRAVAGFSMGAAQSLHIFFSHLDRFSAVGALATGSFAEDEHAAVLADAKATNARIDLLWIGCGRQDPAFAGAERLVALFGAKQIRHTWRPVEGVHNYAFVRGQMVEFLPRLFRKS